MSVSFILGRAGAGKTHWCVSRILDACRAQPLGPSIVYVVPKQATFSMQRRLAISSGIPGFCRVRVVSFDRWIDQIIAECGGGAAPAVTPRGRRFILQHLLRELSPALRVFGAAARRMGLADELDRTFVEFENSGQDASTLSSLIDSLAADNDASPACTGLINKLHDLRKLYAAYEDYLGQDRLDPHCRAEQCIASAMTAPSLKSAQVFIDGHLDFSTLDCKLIAAAAKVADGVHVTLLLDPILADVTLDSPQAQLALFHRPLRAFTRLRQALTEQQIPYTVTQPPAFERNDGPLAAIERQFFCGNGARPIDCGGSITTLQLADQQTEIAAAATIVRRWLREGMRSRDIAVLTRTSDWQELIATEFAAHGIPTFSDRRRTAAHHPLLQTVWAILQSALRRYPHEAMMTLAKAGLAGLSRTQADELENYVLRHGIVGLSWERPEPWTFAQRFGAAAADLENPEDPDIDEETDNALEPDHADADRQTLVKPLRSLATYFESAEKLAVRGLCGALLDVLYSYGVDQKLAHLIEAAEADNQHELSAEHQQVWAEFTELLDELVDLLGDETMSAAEFVQTIESALSQFDLAIAPPGVDQVTLGDVERTRFDHFRGVVVMGMNQGEFPLVASEPTVLGDFERRRLSTKISLEPGTERRLLDEPLLAYLGLTRATEELVITRHLADADGHATNPSPYWWELSRALPGMAVDVTQPTEFRLECTARSVTAEIANWARGDPAGDASATAWIYQHLVTSELPARRLLMAAARGLAYNNAPRLAPEIVAELYGENLELSVTQIESFARCPFQHFARSVLRLELRPEPDVNVLDLGSLYHGVLERVVRTMIGGKQKWNRALRPPVAVIRDIAREVGAKLRGQLVLGTARNQYLLRRLEEEVDQVLARQHTCGEFGELHPRGAELGFGLTRGGEELDPLELRTPEQRRVLLHGRIDRVDIAEDPAVAAVFDYKLGQDQLALADVYHGFALQLITYLLVLQANGTKLAGKPLTPIAAFYIRLLKKIESIAHPDDATDPQSEDFYLTPQRGAFDLKYAGSLCNGEKAANVLALEINKDGSHRLDKGDQLAHEEFVALLKHVQTTIGQLVDRMAGGEIAIQPYRVGTSTPCGHCDYRDVCRFELPTNQFKPFSKLGRKEVIQIITGAKK